MVRIELSALDQAEPMPDDAVPTASWHVYFNYLLGLPSLTSSAGNAPSADSGLYQ